MKTQCLAKPKYKCAEVQAHCCINIDLFFWRCGRQEVSVRNIGSGVGQHPHGGRMEYQEHSLEDENRRDKSPEAVEVGISLEGGVSMVRCSSHTAPDLSGPCAGLRGCLWEMPLRPSSLRMMDCLQLS